MKVTIIETGLPPAAIRSDWPGYPDMFQRLVGKADSELSFETVSIVTGAAPPDPATLDAILITGSPAGVYDPEPWMPHLMDFIRWAADAETPQVGVCFGHQAIAQALGGRVAKSEKGWGIGRHEYDIVYRPDWMADAPDRFSIAVSHQDQVLDPPPGARTLARSSFTPFAALAYESAPVVSFQGHPEFENGYAAALYSARRGQPLAPCAVDEAIASLDRPHANDEVATWIAKFLRHHAKGGRA